MDCVLHIGTEKTATKSIQRFLSQNRNLISSAGFFYPTSPGLISSSRLAVAAYNPNRHDDISISYGIDPQGGFNLEEFQRQTISNLNEELALFKDAKSRTVIIFSSEHFQSRLSRPDEIFRLKEILNKVGITRIRVLVYLRNPTEIAASLYSTAVKSGYPGLKPLPPENLYFNNVCNHQSTLEKFGDVFGYDSLFPRIFNPTMLVNGSVLDDFIKASGIPDDMDFAFPGPINESLSGTAIELLARVNRQIPRLINNRLNPVRRDLVSFFESNFKGPKYHLPEDFFYRYQNAFSASNEWVRLNFFQGVQTLFPFDKPNFSGGCEIPPCDLDDIAQMIVSIWMHQNLNQSVQEK